MNYNDDESTGDEDQVAREAELLVKVRQIRTLHIHAQCVDRATVNAKDANRSTLLEHQGYLPHGLGLGGGDYIKFEVDIETGQILNWEKPTYVSILRAFGDD
jgi:CDP-diacylglycerol pyrophosphatase